MSALEAEKALRSEKVFEGSVVGLRVDQVILPSGRATTREVVEHSPSVVIVPVDDDDNVVLVRQYRYPVGIALLEAPAGMVEEGEEAEECADRELREETGLRARTMLSLGQFWMSPGYCNELMHAFVARDLVSDALEPDEDEAIEIERVPLAAATQLIRDGAIQDAKTIAALLMAIR